MAVSKALRSSPATLRFCPSLKPPVQWLPTILDTSERDERSRYACPHADCAAICSLGIAHRRLAECLPFVSLYSPFCLFIDAMALPGLALRLLCCHTILFGGFTVADQFITPSNSVTDLYTQYTIGQTVNITWSTSLNEITLVIAHWGGSTVGSLLCTFDPSSELRQSIDRNSKADTINLCYSGCYKSGQLHMDNRSK